MTVTKYLTYFIEKEEIKNVFQLSGRMINQQLKDEMESHFSSGHMESI